MRSYFTSMGLSLSQLDFRLPTHQRTENSGLAHRAPLRTGSGCKEVPHSYLASKTTSVTKGGKFRRLRLLIIYPILNSGARTQSHTRRGAERHSVSLLNWNANNASPFLFGTRSVVKPRDARTNLSARSAPNISHLQFHSAVGGTIKTED